MGGSEQGLDAAVAAATRDEPGILAAYVFGSRAGDAGRTGSDLDVAILLSAPGPAADLPERVAARIEAATGLPADVAMLSERAPVLAFEVLSGGRRVFVRDAERADEVDERLLRIFLDTAYLRRVQHHDFFGSPL